MPDTVSMFQPAVTYVHIAVWESKLKRRMEKAEQQGDYEEITSSLSFLPCTHPQFSPYLSLFPAFPSFISFSFFLGGEKGGKDLSPLRSWQIWIHPACCFLDSHYSHGSRFVWLSDKKMSNKWSGQKFILLILPRAWIPCMHGRNIFTMIIIWEQNSWKIPEG